ncbi:hypothetical protein CNMCM8927_003519 [Aspergillus lentulus]|uniref:Cyanovirin-N domain-containing protein n=1 Tax=Aspergillus lentulus TaxID=293939 RepID=A0AAN5YSJ1_ASPLE|nr:hypothetical protein CNMCM8060_002482 [Aspergillus lentulus]KAF4194940.1 hypothetical protein CNMCM8694_006953 [Aspergillus lentulus]KAF4207245.1 hypothetical protein CNMCM8927_003519 [Aspergillus lentulus]
MSFHQSSQDIHIRQEDGCTLLLANVRDSHGQLIQRKIRLDDHIGNTDGWFIWGGTNFTRTARNISLEHTAYGPKLCAELQTRDGGWSRGLQGIMLSEKIANNDGHLKFLIIRRIGATDLVADARNSSGRRVPNKIRLDDHIGEKKGRLVWGGQNFTHSAGQVSLEQTEHGAIMRAEMNKDGGSANRQELNLSEKIVNFDGQLRVV